jgi:hypothetical protein
MMAMTGYKESMDAMYNDNAHEVVARELRRKKTSFFPLFFLILVAGLLFEEPYNFLIWMSVALFFVLSYSMKKNKI